MGQKASISFSHHIVQGKLSFFLKPWNKHTTLDPHPEQPIKIQFKTTRKVAEHKKVYSLNNLKGVKTQSNVKNINEINAVIKRNNNTKHQRSPLLQEGGAANLTLDKLFGYEIQDVDSFLTKATLDKPANIPVVLAFPCTLYRTRIGGYQTEVSLPLGMVVNGVFKNQHWLYVQTPHREEGYVSYAACLPLGIIPMQDDDMPSPCWEKSTDVFPKPSGNMTDTEKISVKSEYEYGTADTDTETTYYTTGLSCKSAFSTCDEKSVDRLYLRATAIAKDTHYRYVISYLEEGVRHTLLVINEDYKPTSKNGISVEKNEVVFLLNVSVQGWFYVKNKEGQEGYIPAVIAGHGFL